MSRLNVAGAAAATTFVREELPTHAAAAAAAAGLAALLDKNQKVELLPKFGHELPATGTAFHSLLLHAAPRRPACWRLQVLDCTCCFTGTKVQIIPMQLLIALAGAHVTCFTSTNVQRLTHLLLAPALLVQKKTNTDAALCLRLLTRARRRCMLLR